MPHDPRTPQETRDEWRRVRAELNAHRFDLSQAAARDVPAELRVLGTPLLARPDWIPEQPIPLRDVRLTWQPDTAAAPIDGTCALLDPIRPLADDGTPYPLYSDALAELARPRLFENRSCYRLLDVEPSAESPRLTYGPGHYFDLIDICEACAHEYAAFGPAQSPLLFREAIGDPTDTRRRSVMTAISTLTIRHDRTAGEAEFLLHWRDPAKVASGGGLYQVMPVGMFQPSHDAPWNLANDFDLWRGFARELSEELLGSTEDYGSDTEPIDYAAWPFCNALAEAEKRGTLTVSWLGLGMDPLTYVTDMLTVAVFDSAEFDELFRHLVTGNDEGHRVGAEDGSGRSVGIAFTEDEITRLTTTEPMQPAGAALLRLAWRSRKELLA